MNQSLIYHGGGYGGGGGFPAGGGSVINPFIAFNSSEGNSSTTSATFVNKCTLNFSATSGVRYRIDFYGEIEVPADEDGEIQGTVGGTQVVFCHFRNLPYATRWSQMNGAFYIDSTLTGTVTVNIDYRSGYGAGNKTIRRARILVTRVD